MPMGCDLEWHYTGSGHGKGPHDGVGEVINKQLKVSN